LNNRTQVFSIIDSSLDFDLNGQRIEGTEAKIVFKSGSLNGQEFTILSYNPTSKTIRYKANEDSNGNVSPFGTMVAEVGDLYTLIGIRMPESYVTAALSELEAKRLEYLNANKVPRVVYELDTDILWLKRQNTELHEGDIVHVVDEKIGLDDNIRVTAVSYPAMFPVLAQGMKFTAEMGNEVTYTRIQKVEKDIKETKEVVTQVSKTSIENDRRNIQALNEFKGLVFDPDGNLENALIQAIAGLFGTDSMYYDLDGISLAVNAGNDANAISLTAGKLIHKRYKIDGLGYIWDLPVFNADGLIATKPYYLSAKCSQTALTGEWVLTTDQQAVDSENGYWFFNLGVLSSVIEGKRSFRPTKMFTMISGGNIETDTITAYFINVVRLFAQLISVGSDGYANAGISGLSDNGNSSVRFWAGATAENRNTAPFRVLQDGSVIASKATIEGVVKAVSGHIGGFEIASGRIGVPQSSDGLSLISSLLKFSDTYSWSGIGSNVFWAGVGYQGLARFEINKENLASYWGDEGVALYTKARFKNDGKDGERIRRSIWNDGNMYSIGKHALFNDGYIGPASTYTIVNNIGVTHTYYFNKIGSPYLNVNLPSRSEIRAKVGNREVTFFLFIQVGSLANTPGVTHRIRVRGVHEGYIIDNRPLT